MVTLTTLVPILVVFFVILISIQYTLNRILFFLKEVHHLLHIMSNRVK